MSAHLLAGISTALTAAALLSVVHLYLLRSSPSVALKLWTVAWGFYTLRFVVAVFMALLPSVVSLSLIHQASTVISALFLVLGANSATEQSSRHRRFWVASAVFVLMWSITTTILRLHPLVVLMPVFVYMAIGNFAIATAYLRAAYLNRPVRRFVAVVFILWGIHKLDYPLFVGIPNAAVWGYAIGSAFTMAAGLGLLILYLDEERARADQIGRRFESLVASMNDVVFALDTEARHTEVYGRWLDAKRGGALSFLGNTAIEVFGENAGSIHVDWARRCIESSEPVTYEWSVPSADGDLQFYQTTLSPIVSASDKGSAMVGVARDITELKRTQFALEQSLEEKTALVQEVHHRVKNNLQVIISMLRLRANATRNDEEVAVTRELVSRIMSMALVHESLYQDENVDAIVFANYLTRLSAEIVRFSSGSNPCMNSSVTGDETKVGMKTAVPLGMIATELIANAVKYAVRPNASLDIRVDFRMLGSNAVLTISDNGPGMGNASSSMSSTNVGLGLVEALCEQIDATFRIRNHDGVQARVTIPTGRVLT